MNTKYRIRVGDVIEVPTTKGLAYIQFTLKKPRFGALIRVIQGFFAERPKDFSSIVLRETRFVAFIPLQTAIDRKIFTIVSNEANPDASETFPLFRAPGHIDGDGQVHDWWLWDGQKSWRIGKLSSEQRKLPIQEVINDTLLIERIEKEWRPEKEPLREPTLLKRLLRA